MVRVPRSRYELAEWVKLLGYCLFQKEIIVPTFGSYGDLLMANGVLKAYSELKQRKLVVVYKNSEMSYNMPFHKCMFRLTSTYYLATRLARYFKNIFILTYGPVEEDRQTHLMQRMASRLNFVLPVGYEPYFLIDTNKDTVVLPSDVNYVTFQSNAKTSFSPNKNWVEGRMKEVVSRVKSRVKTIQLGLDTDADIEAKWDFRGKYSLRQTIYILSKSKLFVGLEGALMHAACAVGTPSVIVFGGYIHPHQSGYLTTTAIASKIECAPCLLTSNCPYGHLCMKEIEVEDVVRRIEGQLSL